MTQNYCDYGNHPIEENSGGYVIYSDQERGIDTVKMCKHCYALHILKFFPNSHMALFLKNNPTEYHLTLEERGFSQRIYKQNELLGMTPNDPHND